MMSRRQVDLLGERFGRGIVIKEVLREDWKNKKEKEYWLRCDCKSIYRVRAYDLINGHTNSCGCLRQDRIRVAIKSSPHDGLGVLANEKRNQTIAKKIVEREKEYGSFSFASKNKSKPGRNRII